MCVRLLLFLKHPAELLGSLPKAKKLTDHSLCLNEFLTYYVRIKKSFFLLFFFRMKFITEVLVWKRLLSLRLTQWNSMAKYEKEKN